MGVFLSFFHAPFVLSFVIGTASACFFPWLLVVILTHRRKNLFLNEFPISLEMIKRALRAGHSVDRALEMVAEQDKGLTGKIFHEITNRTRLGESLESVLADISNRIGIDDFRMLAIVLVLQRETGGSLAEAVENFSKVIRAQENIRKKVKALTGEVRATATIITCIPFFIFGAVYFASPRYLEPLFITETGHTILIVGASMLSIGIGMIFRMIYKDIY